jgi:hypothetical protein
MWFNHFQVERMMEERARNALREAEQRRQIQAAKGPKKARGRWTPVALMLSSLLALVVRPQS